MSTQLLRYAGAGAIGTACQFLVLLALVEAGGVHVVVASTIGAAAGALVNYTLNHRFTFASERAHAVALPRFAAVAALGMAINALTLALLVSAGVQYVVAQVVATAFVLVSGYLANRSWTF